ncbi:DNA mismatch repair protein MutS [Tenacibaculum sp. 1B UA]|uniref:Smr/MutS family protein n=1 Tax=unclassified Tenacibaculum TaxID=2635139 RepID=UPI0026E34817|nr:MULTISPECIES: Smr/MutS family protein [unclassified Tenacibaculum]MDO6675974.1 DNA mismatch repair protein MutS [Tenacibaculum sp. 1_MG-2023]MDX8554065.1 DNA mismatch repair protein MutS [Tenacibaculum sp. 1B UA]
MCLEIGNKVAVIDANIRGVVVKLNGDNVFVLDDEGMEYCFTKKELVKVEVDQNELSKYSDINNPMLKAKIQSKEKKKKTSFVKDKKEVIMEVDLHAEKLVKSTRGMDNFDILSLQINTAKHKLEYCISKKISKLVLIHGIGDGVLKTELKYLLNNYPVKYYDASYQKYGQGATEVYVFQNG